MSSLSKNEIITWDIVRGNLASPNPLPWDFESLSKNPNISLKIINDNPDFDWDYEVITKRADYTIEDVKKYPNIEWDFSMLSRDFTLAQMAENPTFNNGTPIPWDEEEFIYNRHELTRHYNERNWDELLEITNEGFVVALFEFFTAINKFMEDKTPIDWTYQNFCAYLGEKYNVDEDDEMEFIEYISKKCSTEQLEIMIQNGIEIDTDGLSKNKNINIDFINLHPEIDWNYYELTIRIPLSDILRNPGKPWEWNSIYENPTLKWENVKNLERNFFYFPCDFGKLTQSKNITWEIIKNNPNPDPTGMTNWDYNWIASSDKITFEEIFRNPNPDPTGRTNWDANSILQNKNIFWHHIMWVRNIVDDQGNQVPINWGNVLRINNSVFNYNFERTRINYRCRIITPKLIDATMQPGWYFVHCRDIQEISTDMWDIEEYIENSPPVNFRGY